MKSNKWIRALFDVLFMCIIVPFVAPGFFFWMVILRKKQPPHWVLMFLSVVFGVVFYPTVLFTMMYLIVFYPNVFLFFGALAVLVFWIQAYLMAKSMPPPYTSD